MKSIKMIGNKVLHKIDLTMAEYYLLAKPGFMLLDDQMTNMDSERKKFATE